MGQLRKKEVNTWIGMILITIGWLYACDSPIGKTRNTVITSANIEKGKQVFIACCASCHKVNQEMTGPALRGVEKRWPDKQKLYEFIRNSQEVIRNDKYAKDLWLTYNQTLMIAQPDLSDKDIRAVLNYINSIP